MTVQEFGQILRTRWKLICGIIVIAVLCALAYSLLVTPKYQASTRLFVSTTSDGTNTQTNDGSLFAQRRVLSYSQLLTGELLAQRTIDKLGLGISARDLQKEITATAPTDTVLIDVDVVDSSPVRARDIANTLSDEFVVMAAGLETPDLGARPNAQVVVQQRANIPDKAVSPKKARNLAIAAVLGAVVGVVIAIVRDRLDRTVKTTASLENVTGVGLLADIPAEPKRNEPLLSFEGDASPMAEAFRELRTNLQALEVDNGPRVLLVAGSDADEGRTVTAINLALALAEANCATVVVDGDLRNPEVAAYLGTAATTGLSTLLTGEVTLHDALQETRFPRLTALTSGAVPPNPAELLALPAAKEVLGQLGAEFDYVVIDSPPLSVTDAAILSRNARGVLVIARCGHTTPERLTRTMDALSRVGAPVLGTVMTMTPGGRGWRRRPPKK